MRVTILGCATSTGVPVVGCECRVCRSRNPKNSRTRSSVLIQCHGLNILIDTSPDLRFQALRHGISRVDAVLYTHSHADHTHGIDDLRVFNFINKNTIRCYANAETLESIRRSFSYIFDGSHSAGGKPQLELVRIDGRFAVGSVGVVPVEVEHAHWTIYGYRIGGFAYITDCSGIPPGSRDKLRGLDVLVLGALRPRPHAAHFSVDQAVEAAAAIGPKCTYLTHMGHELDYDELRASLPPGVEPAYDGLTVELADPPEGW